MYAGRWNEEVEGGGPKISYKLRFPLLKYMPKKFTLSLNILLLFFEQGKPKEEQNMLKIE